MRFQNEGTELYATIRGEGEPLVFLHGGLADHRASLLHVQDLPNRLILPDLRASGRSHFHGELSWDLLADDLRALLDALQIPRAIVGGVSMGSGVAIRFALRHPQYVESLRLIAPVYGEALNAQQVHAFDAMHRHAQRAAHEGIDALVPLFSRLPGEIRERAIAMVRSFDPQSVLATTRFLSSHAAPFAQVAELAAIRAPAVIGAGSDPEHPREVAELYARTIPNAQLL
jgi:pimeloyl-ACP methyl ester carboxylesterase